MNIRAQEFNIGAAVLGLIGGGIAFFLSTRMDQNIIYSLFIGVLGVVICYIIGAAMSNS